MKLSTRLLALAHCIDDNAIVADIGCDHAQLCIKLVLDGKCQKAYACDINEGPLQQARKNVEYYNLSDKISICLSDGLNSVSEDVTHVVIAGMGFETIQTILNQNLDKCHENRTFVVQSNTDVEGLRHWISEHNFKITKEFVLREEQHFYQMIVFQCCYDDALNEEEIRFGKVMRKDLAFYSMWKYRLAKLEQVLASLPNNHEKYQDTLNEMLYIYKEFGSE